MTANEFMWSKLPHNTTVENENIISNIIKEYARLKCQELLQILVEKVKTKIEYSSAIKGHFYNVVDKDSILNAVDLDSFCS